MEYSISKTFDFAYAHRLLLPYSSKCSVLHGHNAKCTIKLSTTKLDENGMVLDFTKLKSFIEHIKLSFDHSTLVNEKDSSLIEFLSEEENNFVTMSSNVTAEKMAEVIAKSFIEGFNDFLKNIQFCLTVFINETDDNQASFTITNEDVYQSESKKENKSRIKNHARRFSKASSSNVHNLDGLFDNIKDILKQKLNNKETKCEDLTDTVNNIMKDILPDNIGIKVIISE